METYIWCDYENIFNHCFVAVCAESLEEARLLAIAQIQFECVNDLKEINLVKKEEDLFVKLALEKRDNRCEAIKNSTPEILGKRQARLFHHYNN